ncbi:DSD1 family PLP-dependent enzyme [Kribbella antibiotica]|uniref:DSD1 family PLP-dependent enzyme n=1 Tax=Kribbella antibiotica TaxID=190195 RepID=A0A4R4ZHC3_9ACTN|nr:alanine racemase [Kribbella antibiotica]TDD56849.1 DSD1 family PLP-dependent enzyme [Kribbella antibiotica]
MPHATDLTSPDTPFAVVDAAKVKRNIARLGEHVDALGVSLRPHVKTAKSVPVADLVHGGNPGPITVSTLAEAEVFADFGYTDILYAVGLDPHKLPRILALLQRGVVLTVLIDSVEQAQVISLAGQAIPTLIEVDCDGHRGGVLADDPVLPQIGGILAATGSLAGVLVHAGESYFDTTPAAQHAAAQHERDVAVAAADRLRAAGLTVQTVSAGSTPTAHAATDLSGVTELRAGNYVFFDLVMAGLGVCTIEDLALSVVVTVIGHRPERGWIVTDGGWMAMSRDRGTANQAVDQGYGLVTDLYGAAMPDLVMSSASQEHGILTTRSGNQPPELPIGTRLRILPNHACATGAQHSSYQVINLHTQGITIDAEWDRIRGW